jgi:hypothetical protein
VERVVVDEVLDGSLSREVLAEQVEDAGFVEGFVK